MSEDSRGKLGPGEAAVMVLLKSRLERAAPAPRDRRTGKEKRPRYRGPGLEPVTIVVAFSRRR
jgi:hypothetical protein